MAKNKFDFITKLIDNNQLSVTVSAESLRNYTRNILSEFENLEMSERYRSKYNAYVVYDYEPLCIEGFNIEFVINCNQFNKLKFIEFVIVDRLQKLINLEKQFNIDIDLRTNEGKLIKKIGEVL